MGDMLSRLPYMSVYLGDMIIFSQKGLEHVEHNWHVITLVAKHGFSKKVKKWDFAKPRVHLLSHIINKN